MERAVPGQVFLKQEFRQRTGSFKDRGALNRLVLLGPDERARGVVTASAGNHAQAVAFHASRLGIPSTIVMPETAPLIKVSNTRAYGARVIQMGTTLSDGLGEVRRLAEEEGCVILPAYDDYDVMAGQGTIGLEILEQVPDVTTVVVPIGGGGIISGIATAVKTLRPEVRIVGVEAEAAPSARASLDAGSPVAIEVHETLADGIAVKRVGDKTFPIIRELVDDVVVVTERELASAIFHLLEGEKMVVEGAGAAPVAALWSGKIRVGDDDRTVAVLCGGNIDVNIIARVIDRGLWADGREARLQITGRDRPGFLSRVTRAVAEMGANVMHISHRRVFGDISVGDVRVVLQLETRGRGHVEEIVQRLRADGHRVEEER